MKKVILMLVMFLGTSVYCMAQSYVDVLYLKDGSVIRGQVIEQIPDKSLKIQTYDGSVFVYNMDQVDKITKEVSRTAKEDVAERRRIRSENSMKRKTLRGYKGFVDGGYTIGDEDWENRMEFSTAHGFQINNYLFVGGGVGLHYYNGWDEQVVMPIFANVRANFLNHKITPFGDAKIGVSAGDIEGLYFSLGIGVRFSMGKKSAFYLSASASMQGYNDRYNSDYYNDYWYSYDEASGLTLRAGFEF